MRSRKYRIITTLERGSNHLTRWALRAGRAPAAFALLETTGRRTGQARQTPVGNGLDGDTFWLVASHGTQADYVRNLLAQPRVRVKAAVPGAAARRSCCPVTMPSRAPGACPTSGTRRSAGCWPRPR